MRQARLLAFLISSYSCFGQNPYDFVLGGGRVVDGTGAAWFKADVAIRGDRVAALGRFERSQARVWIDVPGMTVAPGFIDIHTHARANIFEVPTAPNYIRQGVTTLMEGNDGGSPIPLRPFLERLSRTPPSVNFGMFAGQGSIRTAVVGLANRTATAEEIGKMKELARQAMLDGAFGLSTGLFYVPGNYTPTEEVIELAKVVAGLGGMHISHIRNEADGLLDSVRETIRIGEEGGLPTQITHHKAVGKAHWGASVETLRLVEEARARGVDVTIDQYPYTASSTGTAALFPQWSQEGGRKALLERLEAPEQRAKIKAGIVRNLRDNRGGGDPKNVVMARCGFSSSLDGRSLAEIARQRGREADFDGAAETAIEIQQQGGCQAIYHAIDEADVERILRFPFTMIASDGEIPIFGQASPHPRSYGTFARVLGRYARQRKTLTLEDAIRKMTSLPAARLGLYDRGVLRPGMKADIVVLDAAAVEDRAEFARPHQYAEGILHVFVNGKPVVSLGGVTGQRPGVVLYGPSHSGL